MKDYGYPFLDPIGEWAAELHDFDNDGKLDLAEAFMAISFLDENDEGPYQWRRCCEDGSEYGVDPKDFQTEEEYEDALEEAKNEWRDRRTEGEEFGIYAGWFDTEEEYDEALREEKAKYEWRECCEDGSEYGLDPDDFETEEEYDEALRAAKYEWRECCEDGSEYGVDPEDFETEEEYNDALYWASHEWQDRRTEGEEFGIYAVFYDTEEEYDEALREAGIEPVYDEDDNDIFDDDDLYDDDDEDAVEDEDEDDDVSAVEDEDEDEEIREENYPNKRRYEAARNLVIWGDVDHREVKIGHFILENADTITAANYLTSSGQFLYSLAIRDHFTLPISLPDEDDEREYEFWEALAKIAKRDIPLSLEVWEWVLGTFFPYVEYTEDASDEINRMTGSVLLEMSSIFCYFPENYRIETVRYMEKHPAFMETVMSKRGELSLGLDDLIDAAVSDERWDMAIRLFQKGIAQGGKDWKRINSLVGRVVRNSQNNEELESAEFVREKILPIVKTINLGMVQDEIEEWEAQLDEYIARMEDIDEKYAYTRKNAWRAKYVDTDTFGLDVTDFQTEEEFQKEYARVEEIRRQEALWQDEAWVEEQRQLRMKQWQESNAEKRKLAQEKRRIALEREMADEEIYTYCGVLFSGSDRVYYYRTDGMTIRVGDNVLVPVRDETASAQVVSVGQYRRVAAPFPVDWAKFILKKDE